MANLNLLEQIPAKDWEATPASVQALILSLLPLAEAASRQRERESASDEAEAWAPLNKHTPAEEQAQKALLRRYHTLVDKLFLSGLSEEEEAEKQQLGQAIDDYNAVFYEPIMKVLDALEAKKKE